MHLTPRFARTVSGLLLALALALPSAASAFPGNLSFPYSPWRLLAVLWAEIGIEADPDGQPSDIGLEVDPSGRTAPGAVTGSIGIVVDPGGQPAANPAPHDIGIEADPNG